jgi:hypothetical protein
MAKNKQINKQGKEKGENRKNGTYSVKLPTSKYLERGNR